MIATVTSPDVKPLPAAAPVKPGVWVVCRQFGEPSETWLWRQVVGMRRLSPRVVCWERSSGSAFETGEIPLTQLPSVAQSEVGWRKWSQRLRHLGDRNFFAASRQEQRLLWRLVANDRPQVMLCHFGHMALRLLPIAARHRIPLVAHFHGLDLSSGLRNRWYRWSLLRHLRDFAALVVVGSHQRRWLLERDVAQERVHLIPCGVPTSEFLPAVRSTPARAARFITISRLVPCKGLQYTLRAFARVHAELPDATLTVVGDGPERQELESLAQHLNLRASVRFCGALKPEEVKAQLQEAVIFLQHSITSADGAQEGFGVSIAEASAMALPVVVTRVGGIMDQVIDQQTGLMIEQRDVDAMADAMLTLANNPRLRETLGSAARQRMIAHFDTAAQVAKLESVLTGVADQNRSG